MFKIDKTLVDNMNINKSCIVITHKETKPPPALDKMIIDDDLELPNEIKEKAKEYLQNAGIKAQRIILDAQTQADEIKEKAQDAGFMEGLEQAQSRHDEQYNNLQNALVKLEEYRGQLFEELQDCVLDLATDMAEKIVNILIERDDTAYKQLVKNAVESMKRSDKFVLYVGRNEHERLFKDKPQWLKVETDCAEYEVYIDTSLKQGDCIIESEKEIIDASVSRQLSKMGQYLKEQVD